MSDRAAHGEPATVGVVGFVGLGLVGRALAQRAVAAGFDVAGCDPSIAARERARALGVAVHADLGSIARACTALVVCVLDDAQLLDVVDGIVASSHAPAVVVSSVTCSPAAADRTAAQLHARGIDFVEMPLSGSSAQIADGTALALVGADDGAALRHRDLLACLAPQSFAIGAVGAAARAKLASNLVLGLNRSALAEGLALACAMGLDGERFLQMLRASPAYSRAVDVAGPRMLARDFEPASRIAQHRKDLRLIEDAARGAGLSLGLTAAQCALLDQAIAGGLGDLDNGAVIAAIDPRRFPPTA